LDSSSFERKNGRKKEERRVKGKPFTVPFLKRNLQSSKGGEGDEFNRAFKGSRHNVLMGESWEKQGRTKKKGKGGQEGTVLLSREGCSGAVLLRAGFTQAMTILDEGRFRLGEIETNSYEVGKTDQVYVSTTKKKGVQGIKKSSPGTARKTWRNRRR